VAAGPVPGLVRAPRHNIAHARALHVPSRRISVVSLLSRLISRPRPARLANALSRASPRLPDPRTLTELGGRAGLNS
jgi:hypothetical protein